MEAKDYWVLLAGAALGYVVNMIAKFTAPPVGTAFGKIKSGFLSNGTNREPLAN